MRYTEYHAEKAVIKDKSKLLEAMEKLAKLEDEEESKDFALSKNEDGTFSVYEKPYAIVDCATKENFEYLKDAVEYYRNKEETSKWIPCSERIPAKQTDVLVTVKYSGFMGMHGTWIKTGHLEHYGWDGDCCGGTVIAWMPLPELYKGE